MTALITSWINRLKEYEGESIDYLTIVLCFVQCWKRQYSSATRDAEILLQEQAAASTSNTRRVPRAHDKGICFEDPARGLQRRVIQFHKAQIALYRAKIRFWFLNIIPLSRKELARQELRKFEDDYNWLVYDWFNLGRPIPLRQESQCSAVDLGYLDQYQSLFFRIPVEIRRLVYRAHLTKITIDIVARRSGKYAPAGYESRAWLDWSCLEREQIRYTPPSWRRSRRPHKINPRRFVDFGIVNLLLTCRLM